MVVVLKTVSGKTITAEQSEDGIIRVQVDSAHKHDCELATDLSFQVSMLGGSVKHISIPSSATWKILKTCVAKTFDVPGPRMRLSVGEDLLIFEDDCLLSSTGITEASILTLTKLTQAWFWADSFGSPIFEEAGYQKMSTPYLRRHPLDMLWEWVEEFNGEDTSADTIGSGIVYIGAPDFPNSAEAVLSFLAGADGDHDPVIPPGEGDEDEECGDSESCAWADAARLKEVDLGDCSCQKNEGYPRDTTRTLIYPPTLEQAARALVCASLNETDEEVMSMASKCTFYEIELKPHDELQGYFSIDEGEGHQDTVEPYSIICVNPSKRTIAFSYQMGYWI